MVMIDFVVACDKLAQFETPDEIAGFLFDEGVKGERQAHASCPIANWLRRQTQAEISVTGLNIWSLPKIPTLRNLTTKECKYSCTDAMMRFITAFDQGRYPQLLAGGEV